MMSSNLLNRSRAAPPSAASRTSGRSAWFTPSLMRSALRELADRIDEVAVGLDSRLLVHADDDIELVLDRGDEIHHRQAVELEVAGERGVLGDGDVLLVERLDQLAHAAV